MAIKLIHSENIKGNTVLKADLANTIKILKVIIVIACTYVAFSITPSCT